MNLLTAHTSGAADPPQTEEGAEGSASGVGGVGGGVVFRVTSLKMTMSVPERKSGSEGKEEESEDESEILEESPCGRWQKRKEQVSPRVCVCV